MKRLISILIILAMLISVSFVSCGKADVNNVTADSSSLFAREAQTARQGSYGEYLNLCGESEPQNSETPANINLAVADAQVHGKTFEWTLPSTAGLYYIRVRYIPHPENDEAGSLVSILINGKLPYNELDSVELLDEYRDVFPITQDKYGNDLRPAQEVAGRETENLLFDSAHTYTSPLAVYLNADTSTLSLEMISGGAEIKAVILEPASAVKTYAQMKELYIEKGYTEVNDSLRLIQGQEAAYKSATTIYPVSDRSSPLTKPQSSGVTKLNSIGGVQWNKSGDYIAWTVDAPKAGLYKISMRVRQNTAVGVVSARSITINGNLPFEEARVISVPYNSKWQTITLGDDNEDWLFYLEEGENEIRLTATLGDMDTVIRLADNTARSLNDIYRRFLIVMGAEPDQLRDYRLDVLCAEEIATLKEQADTLAICADWLEDYSGKGNSGVALMRTMLRQLNKMHQNPDTIPTEFSYFKTNIGSLSTWSNNAKMQPLSVDVIAVGSDEDTIPKSNAGFFENLRFGFSKLLYSFSANYTNMGDIGESKDNKEPLTIWIGGGREQAQIVRNLVAESFTKETGIPVQIQLVQAPLLSATVAGTGPDAVINSSPDVFNFAMRNAAVALSDFSDYKDVKTRFQPSLSVPFTYLGKVYALPETISFPLLYYRKDVLEELGVSVPETWDDVIALSNLLSKKNMEFGIPTDTANLTTMYMTIYKQRGLQVYANGGEYCLLDSVDSVEAFRFFTNMYANYGFPLSYNFLNRFRTGEMPIGIAGFNFYNEIPVAAPEINDLWDIAQIPGTRNSDGSIERTAVSNASGTMILSGSKRQDDAWEFIKWWTSADIQREFAAEIEGLLGPSARYSSANMEAFKYSSWPSESKAVFNRQMENLTAIESVPGGYFLNRNITNMFRSVVYRGTLPTDALYDYTYKINRELTQKRKEFGLDVLE